MWMAELWFHNLYKMLESMQSHWHALRPNTNKAPSVPSYRESTLVACRPIHEAYSENKANSFL